ncbi:MAG: aspartate aminotransferase family protein [Alphaproteobacteria bacterium]|nr:aspartate aminotransferase family protein [Alphaproteobacteria bacterium]MDP6622444.1 aspartate aminotransferase family protein [Alphaproteobacteria bacterium]
MTMSVLMPTYARIDIAFEKGEGPYLFTGEGRRYLDFAAGIAVNALGHAHPKLVAALKSQAERLWHVSNLYQIPEQQRLAERLVANCFADTVFFCNSGAEAVECGIKLCRAYHNVNGNPERHRVITAEGAFHGRTLATLAAGRQEKHLAGFAPMVEGFDQVPFGDADAMAAAVGPETAAILVEPVQGESGIKPVPAGYLARLRQIADASGILLFFDEVQCGLGRTGKLFAHQWEGVAPDVMALAKALGGGFPIGACLASETAAAGMQPGSHGSTFGGNPLAVAVGNAVLNVILEEGFLESVARHAGGLRQRLEGLVDRHPEVVEEVRGEGLMLGLKVKPTNLDVVTALREAGLLTVPAGENVVRLLPPLNIESAQIDEAVGIIEQVCAELTESGD